VLDRESTFGDEELVSMLKEHFIPVAIDQWYTRAQKDAEGEFYQSIARQGPRKDMNSTTQGLYVCDAAGKYYGSCNNRNADTLKGIMREALKTFDAEAQTDALEESAADPRYDRSLPQGAVVIQVNTKVLGGYKETNNEFLKIFQRSIVRDNLWILTSEIEQLKRGVIADSLSRRIARFHLIDNTRGEPNMWSADDIKSMEMSLTDDGNLKGEVEVKSSQSGFRTKLFGIVKFDGDRLQQFDVVSRGWYHGEGTYTKNAPEGEFPLAVAFRIADGNDSATSVAPQGSKGWLERYLKP
jgi:hypothetical protein